MSTSRLPEVCRKCRKLKMPDLGRWKRVAGRMHDRYWICYTCQPETSRITGAPRQASPLERKVIPVLVASGYHFIREQKVGHFQFDFAIPRLRLLIEADSFTYHRRPWQRKRDEAKDQYAFGQGWRVVRVRDPDIEGWTRKAIEDRAFELGLG